MFVVGVSSHFRTSFTRWNFFHNTYLLKKMRGKSELLLMILYGFLLLYNLKIEVKTFTWVSGKLNFEMCSSIILFYNTTLRKDLKYFCLVWRENLQAYNIHTLWTWKHPVFHRLWNNTIFYIEYFQILVYEILGIVLGA